MDHYRVFDLGPNGRFRGVIEVEAEGDDAAIRAALQQPHPNGCEIWAGPRFLGRFAGPRPNPSSGPEAA